MLRQRLEHSGQAVLNRNLQRFQRTAAKLDALSPLKVLGRGYSIVRKEDGHVVSSAKEVKSGDKLRIRLLKDELSCTAD